MANFFKVLCNPPSKRIENICSFITILLVIGFTIYAFNTLNPFKIVQEEKQYEGFYAYRDILNSIEFATWGSFEGANVKGIYYFEDDYRHPLLLQSPIDKKEEGDAHIASNNPPIKRYLLYYIVRPPGDTCKPNNPISNPDVWCPHKWLIKKELKRSAFRPNITVTFDMLKKYLNNNLQDRFLNWNVISTEVTAKGLINFNIIPPQKGSECTGYYNGTKMSMDRRGLIMNFISLWDTVYEGKKALKKSYSNVNFLSKSFRQYPSAGLQPVRSWGGD